VNAIAKGGPGDETTMTNVDRMEKLDPWRLTIRRDDPRLTDLSEAEKRQLRAAQIGAVVALMPTILLSNLVNLALLIAMFWHLGHDLFLLVWGSALAVTIALGYISVWAARRAGPRQEASSRGVRRLTLNSFVLGALWTMPIIYLFTDASQPQSIILACLAAGMVAGGALVMATVFQAALVFMLVVMVPSLGHLLWLGGSVYLFLSGMMLSFVYLIVQAVVKHGDLFVDSHFANSKLRNQSQIIGLLLKDFEEGASDFLWETDAKARLTRVSGRLAQLIGLPSPQLEGRDFVHLIREFAVAERAVAIEFEKLLNSGEAFRDHVVALEVKGENRLWSLTGKPISDAHGAFLGYRGVGSDVTDAERLAKFDLLTGLPNRSAFERETEKAIARLNRESRPFAVMTLDLDRFKRVNDTLGHAVGDALLAAAARRIVVTLGANARVTRFGGDEFVALLEGADAGIARELCERLIDEMKRPFELGDFTVMVGVSIGVALAPAEGRLFDDLLRYSDLALYRAKADGRGRCSFYAASLDEAMQARRQLEVDLRGAMQAGQFSLHYQPLVDTLTGAITSCEALLRWRHPTRGDVGPSEFIPLAEETGLVGAIGEWVLREACREAAHWPREIRVAVNVSAIQFRNGELAKTIALALSASGLPAERLDVEITESVFIDNRVEAQRMLQSIHDLGVLISLDDFGTGYSSLSYLCSFAFDKIKIDKSFVQAIDNAANGAAVVRAIAALAHSLGVRMTAEGVETEDQLTRLADFGCQEAQGFLFSRPLRAKDLRALFGREGDLEAGRVWALAG
jgi:diguanylate cyclase (GGDEF)-like protein